MTRAAPAILLVAVIGCGSGPVARVDSPEGGERLAVCIEEATTAEDRRRGLTGREPLGEGEGLLITFPTTGEVCIVNEEVGYAIDVIYADDDGRVVAVEHEVPAGDGEARCKLDTRRVLEVRAGVAATARAGDRLIVD